MLNHIHLDGKGKVERCFRTVKDSFFNTLNWNNITSIEQAQDMYTEFLNNSYLNSVHSAINVTPRERFMKNFDCIVRKSDEEIKECFLHKVVRRVKSDSTISLNSIIYEVPQQFVGKYITIKYNPEDMSILYIYNDKNERLHIVKALDKISNSKYKRQNIVSFYREENDDNV